MPTVIDHAQKLLEKHLEDERVSWRHMTNEQRESAKALGWIEPLENADA